MEFTFNKLFPIGRDRTEYCLLTKEYVSTVLFEGQEVLKIEPEGITRLAAQAMHDVAFMLRAEHNEQVAKILDDPEASENDKTVALIMLLNAEISAKGELPFCQDTGTATIIGKKGQRVWTGGGDEKALSKGVFETYQKDNLRYSQTLALDMFTEKNSGNNLPAQIDLYAVDGDEYQFLMLAKGGGCANKTYLYQETKALLNPQTLENFLIEKMRSIGTAACPPYHLAFVIGGTSAEACLKTVKLASAKYLDYLPPFRDGSVGASRDGSVGAFQNCSDGEFRDGSAGEFRDGSAGEFRDGSDGEFQDGSGGALRDGSVGALRDVPDGEFQDGSVGALRDGSDGEFQNVTGGAFRDIHLENRLLRAAQRLGLGAQFGGKYFAHDIRVIRLPRHGASCPVGMGVSCSADRNIKCKINKEGLWIEKLDANPGRLIPDVWRTRGAYSGGIKIDLNRPMQEVRAQLSQYPVSTFLLLSGTIIVGRDIAHAKLKERLDNGEGLPQYLKNHPIYYAGPAKTPKGMPSGSFGPTTAGRMDSYVALFQKEGASLVMIAKGNRSQQVTDSCRKYGGFYLGSIGGPAALLAQDNIKKVEVLAYPDLGMEAIWKIEVEDFPAFVLVDDKGNDFFQM